MTMAVAIFVGSLLALYLLDHISNFGKAWFGPYRWFAIYHIALIFTSTIMADRLIGKTQPELLYALFIAAAIGGAIWAGLLGRALERQEQ
ncbi:MAG: hypothetical protein ACOY94_28925 [Bacillota bacterium]